MEVLGAQRIRELDARAIAGGTPGSELMERAGYGAYLFLRRVAAPRAERVLVVAGKGNNAGDAFVVAYYLLAAGRHVELCLLGRGEEMSRDAGEKWERIRGLQVCHCYAGDAEAVWGCVRRWHGDVIVDGVLGTGVRGELAPAYRAAIEAMNAHPAPVLALDIPSGLDADTGEPHGVAVRAAWTVTFGHPKRGMMEAVAREYCGRIEVVDIGLEREGGEGGVKMLSSAEAGEMLPVRALDAHKHGCGHVLVVAGSRGMTGAAALCARAALASGAGLVTLAVPEALVGLVAPVNPACMTLPVPDGGTGEFGPGGLRVVTEFLRRCRALAIGPGMGRSVVVGEFLRGLLKEVRVPTVVDADGLNYLAEAGEVMEWLRGGRYVLTPHPGEFERLSGNRPGDGVKERVRAAVDFARGKGVTVVLKGHLSVIASREGEVWVNPTGNAGMATAGTGDVLTGMIAGLLGQGLGPDEAARVGAYVHGLAGDCAAGELGVWAMTAEDVIERIGVASQYVVAARCVRGGGERGV